MEKDAIRVVSYALMLLRNGWSGEVDALDKALRPVAFDSAEAKYFNGRTAIQRALVDLFPDDHDKIGPFIIIEIANGTVVAQQRLKIVAENNMRLDHIGETGKAIALEMLETTLKLLLDDNRWAQSKQRKMAVLIGGKD